MPLSFITWTCMFSSFGHVFDRKRCTSTRHGDFLITRASLRDSNDTVGVWELGELQRTFPSTEDLNKFWSRKNNGGETKEKDAEILELLKNDLLDLYPVERDKENMESRYDSKVSPDLNGKVKDSVYVCGVVGKFPPFFIQRENFVLAKFSLSVQRYIEPQIEAVLPEAMKSQYKRSFLDIEAWNELAVYVKENISPGVVVAAQGNLSFNEYIDKKTQKQVRKIAIRITSIEILRKPPSLHKENKISNSDDNLQFTPIMTDKNFIREVPTTPRSADDKHEFADKGNENKFDIYYNSDDNAIDGEDEQRTRGSHPWENEEAQVSIEQDSAGPPQEASVLKNSCEDDPVLRIENKTGNIFLNNRMSEKYLLVSSSFNIENNTESPPSYSVVSSSSMPFSSAIQETGKLPWKSCMTKSFGRM